MTGHAMPWNDDLSGTQKQAIRDAKALGKKTADLEKQQEREKIQLKRKLNQQQISMLRSRFSQGGGRSSSSYASRPIDVVGDGGSTNQRNMVQPLLDFPSTLFSRITGQN